MSLRRTIGLSCVILVACVRASSEQVRGPDGAWWYSIDCRHSQTACLEEAGDDCPHGYVTADESGGEDGAVASTVGSTTFVKSTYHGTMLIKCKNSDGDSSGADTRPDDRLRRCQSDRDCRTGETCKWIQSVSGKGWCR